MPGATASVFYTSLTLWQRPQGVTFHLSLMVEKLQKSCILGRMQGLVKNIVVSSIIGAIFVMMSVGGVLSSEMMMQDGMMIPCPFMGVSSLCNMTPLEHVSQWQQMFTTTSQEFATTATLLLLSLVVVFSFVQLSLKLNRTPVRLVSRYRYRERAFDPLRLAFARGILHPKLY